jgi:hypothetical protein
MERIVRKYPYQLAAITMGSGIMLYNIMEYMNPITNNNKNTINNHSVDEETRRMEHARLRAMIENAQQSTWQQNLDNALIAQEKFMLGSDKGEKEPEFMKQINKRSNEIMELEDQQRQKDLEREKKRKPTLTKIW